MSRRIRTALVLLAVVMAAGICSLLFFYEPGNSRYPYTANRERTGQILDRYAAVQAGMTVEQVHLLLGKPDVSSPLLEPNKPGGSIVGTNAMYVISQERPNPSWHEWTGVLVRYDLNNVVTELVPVGLTEKAGQQGSTVPQDE